VFELVKHLKGSGGKVEKNGRTQNFHRFGERQGVKHIKFPAKLLDYFLQSYKRNINQGLG